MRDRTIPLTRGCVAVVSDEDYLALSRFNWFATKDGYAARNVTVGPGRQRQVYMHHCVCPPPEGAIVDHRDGDGLNNTRDNLRICTQSQNQWNRRPTKGFKGVCFHKAKRRWIASIFAAGRRMHLGYFDTDVEAARAYDAAAREHFGEFARLNITEGAVA